MQSAPTCGVSDGLPQGTAPAGGGSAAAPRLASSCSCSCGGGGSGAADTQHCDCVAAQQQYHSYHCALVRKKACTPHGGHAATSSGSRGSGDRASVKQTRNAYCMQTEVRPLLLLGAGAATSRALTPRALGFGSALFKEW